MENYQTITVCTKGPIARIELNRPEIHNAFDDNLILELSDVLRDIATNSNFRVVVLSGNGKSFCSGADMHWMERMKGYQFQENYEDAYRLSRMLRQLYSMPIPTIAKVHGAAVGGGVGVVAACDIVIAAEDTIFSLSEVRLGLVPACISPYLLKRINPGLLRGYFLTGHRFSAPVAKEIGLVNDVVEKEHLDQTIEDMIGQILECGPQALKMAKELLARIPQMKENEYMEYTAKMIADLRVSEEGQEGLSAFLNKRDPVWKNSYK